MTAYPNQIDGYSSIPVVVDLVSPIRAGDINRLRSAIIATQTELGINPSGTFSSVKDRIAALEEFGVGGSGGSSGENGSGGTGYDYISGMIETPADKTYRLVSEIPYDGYIGSLTTKSTSGTCTLTAKINGVSVGGTPNAASSTEVSQIVTTPNEFVAGDEISITVSSNSSCADLTFTLLLFVTPGGEFGEANYASNVGASGVGLYKQKIGRELQFRNIAPGSSKVSVTLDSSNNEVDIDVIENQLTISGMTGTLPISMGGTSNTSATSAFGALSPLTTKGDLVAFSTLNTRLAVGTDGYLLSSDSTQGTGLKWASPISLGFQPRVCYKTVDEVVVSSTTLQADDALSIYLPVGSYMFSSNIFGSCTSGSGAKIKVSFGGTITNVCYSLALSKSSDLVYSDVFFDVSTEADITAISTGSFSVGINGTIDVSVAGTFSVQWAQSTSSVSNLTFKKGSYLRIEEI